jgi:hypothetical protein
MIRPLYLEPTLRWTVRLDEGHTLNVSAPGRARSLFPLTRLSRVICPATAEWTTNALLECLRFGIPVVFHDAKGDPLGWCFGPRRRETTLASLLREAIDRGDGRDLLASWTIAMERHEVLAALRAANTQSEQLAAAQARARLCNVHRRRLGFPIGAHLRALQRSCSALVAQQLQACVGDPELIGFAAPGQHLGWTVSTLLEWQCHRVICESAIGSFVGVTPARYAAEALESHSGRLSRACGEMLGHLERHLRQCLL